MNKNDEIEDEIMTCNHIWIARTRMVGPPLREFCVHCKIHRFRRFSDRVIE